MERPGSTPPVFQAAGGGNASSTAGPPLAQPLPFSQSASLGMLTSSAAEPVPAAAAHAEIAADGEAGEAELAQRQELAPGGRRDATAISMPHLGLLPIASRQEVK